MPLLLAIKIENHNKYVQSNNTQVLSYCNDPRKTQHISEIMISLPLSTHNSCEQYRHTKVADAETNNY